MAAVDPSLIQSQGARSVPLPGDFATETGLIIAPSRVIDRLRHMPEEVYSLDPASHIVRFMQAILGDAGAGQTRKAYLLARLRATLQGSHFFDLDHFYGALFNLSRTQGERIQIDPTTGAATSDQWSDVLAADASYRSRIMQFARGIGYGATPAAMEVISEAILGVDCDVFESFLTADQPAGTYGSIENAIGTYGAMEGYTWGQLEGLDVGNQRSLNRYTFTIVPKKRISAEDRHQVLKVLNRIKPAHTLVQVDTDGVEVHRRANLRGAWADSEYWEIIPKVSDNANVYPGGYLGGEPVERPRPAFSAHQGEAWSIFTDISGVLNYAENEDDATLISGEEFERVVWAGGTFTDYDASKGVFPVIDTLLARAAADGVLVSHPYPDILTNTTDPRPMYVDRIPLADALKYLKIHPTTAGTLNADPAQRFWSTPQRSVGGMWWYWVYAPTNTIIAGPFVSAAVANSIRLNLFNLPVEPGGAGPRNNISLRQLDEPNVREILEIRLNQVHLVNYVSVEVPHFPHDVTIEVFDEDTASWVSVMTESFTDAVPMMFFNRVATPGGEHPQHKGAGHWVKIEGRITPYRTQRIRLVSVRRNGLGPLQWIGSFNWQSNARFLHNNPYTDWVHNTTSVPYSLGARNFDAGYQVLSQADIPREPARQPVADRSPTFGATRDVLGSMVSFGIHEERAQDLLRGGQWRSEPMPKPNAIVNLYLDTRGDDGEGQVIDRFYLEPIDVGPTFHIYSSDDDPDPAQPFVASDDPLPYGVITTTGSVVPTNVGIVFAPGDVSYLDLANAAIQWKVAQPWWIGLDLATQFHSHSGEHPIFDFGGNVLKMTAGSLDFESQTGDSWSVPVFFNVESSLRIVIGYVPTSTPDFVGGAYYEVWVQVGDQTVHALFGAPHKLVDVPFEALRFGAYASPSADPAAYTITHSIIKQTTVVAAEAESFIATPSDFVTKSRWAYGEDHSTDSAIVRSGGEFVLDDYPYGIVGGPGEFYDSLRWKPLERDFTLQKGFVHVPVLRAKFFKFEFTNLVPEPFENYVPVQRTVKTFPPQVVAKQSLARNTADAVFDPGVAESMLQVRLFADEVKVRLDFGSAGPFLYRGTDALYSTDLESAINLAARSSTYSLQPFHVGATSPMFDEVGTHSYTTTVFHDESKLGFFVGVKTLQAYKIDYLVADDTPAYFEYFYNLAHIAQMDWDMSPHLMNADGHAPCVAQSYPFLSLTPITAVQFATHETPPIQLLRDDDFVDPAKIFYDWTDNDDWHSLGDAQIDYDQLQRSAHVNRNVDTQPGVTPSDVGLVEPPIHSVYSLLRRGPVNTEAPAHMMGGIESEPIDVSPRGQGWTAIRFTALSAITNPWWLQIVGTDGTVLAEKPITAQKGEVVETYLGYTLGSFTTNYTPPEGFYPRHLVDRIPRAVANYEGPTPIPDPLPPPDVGDIDNTLRVRLVQFGASHDELSIDTFSFFEDAVLWEFSNDGGTTFTQAIGIRNNANGVLSFVNPGGALVWRATAYRSNVTVTGMQIRPWYGTSLDVRKRTPRSGPNLSTFDQQPPITEDPDFLQWSVPIPRAWWAEARKYPVLPVEGAPIITQFSRTYVRQVAEALPSLTDAASRQGGFFSKRAAIETVAVPADQAVGGRLYQRSASEGVPTPNDGANAVKIATPATGGDTLIVDTLPMPPT